jgi:hypothetical protein
MLVFWVVTPCGLTDGYQRFGGIYCRHFQGWMNIAFHHILLNIYGTTQKTESYKIYENGTNDSLYHALNKKKKKN